MGTQANVVLLMYFENTIVWEVIVLSEENLWDSY